jgi:hypothetical protein
MPGYPKPEKREKEKITAAEFRIKYGSNRVSNKRKSSKKFPTAQERFYKSTAWCWMRRYILTLHCDPKTMTVPDYTGTGILPIKGSNTHVGHLVKAFDGNSSHMATALDERNLLPQHGATNRYHGGAQDRMAIAIDSYWGPGTSKALVEKSREFKKYSEADLKEVGENYKQKTYSLIEEKGVNKWWLSG